ncbi:lipopolysaccharide transport system ATP-binding protein [Algoriphagus sp. 4150]|uniref:ABC transporter ATP-binding protein n=1 Tax=Algoriphagus sp. 4150 TaxID=2817756 RepID=UPI0028547EDD|nr:ABC transporter ATP-binding protein [Algoriphagus sp. 4150]MDR7127719.1 lipopolysaccharide transport system ATP-binding protein [Algoriphagus sp. 4150]
MSKTVIKVENLSKRYRIGLKEKQAETLAGQVANLIKSPWQNLKRLREMSRFGVEDESVFWALKDVNFEVKEGEVLGIIGKNGAGKSTLLKILSQITEPTSGRIEIHGRVASLLEVGTGFHPELSGRENIYMNGTILGMTRKEIDSKLDEIIDFSGVEKFIDTPVKFYSSGMKVRLGFSVAAHLEPEILIIDEVLAVGDYEFQQKCLGKMEDVSKNQGRTVLFVSHQMDAINSLCQSVLVLDRGTVDIKGDVQGGLERYMGKLALKSEITFTSDLVKPSILEVKLFQSDNELKFRVVFESPFLLNEPSIGIVVYNQFGSPVFGSNPRFHKSKSIPNKTKKGIFEAVVNNPELHSGIYKISVWLGDSIGDYDVKLDTLIFEYVSNKKYTQKPDPKNIGSIDKFFDWKFIEEVYE